MNLWHNLRGNLLNPAAQNVLSEDTRSFSKWWLEICRNLVAVAALQYLATKTGNILIHALAFSAYAALFIYCYSYIRFYIPNTLAFIRNTNRRALAALFILILVGGTGYFILITGLGIVVEELARIQGPPTVAVWTCDSNCL